MEVYVTTAGAILCAIISGYFAWRTKRAEMNLKHAELQIADEREALSFEDYFAQSARLFAGITNLCESTEIDRVLLLVAWNGKLAPRWTTAVWQYRTGQQVPQSYVHTEIDSDYVDRLKELRMEPMGITWLVEDMPESLIKSIYESEGVLATSWHLIRERPKGQGIAVTYMSFSTHSEGSIKDATKTKCGVLANRIAGDATGSVQPVI